MSTTLANLQSLRQLIIAEHDKQLCDLKAQPIPALHQIIALEKSRARYAQAEQDIELTERWPFGVTKA